jgi:hypothetical protein
MTYNNDFELYWFELKDDNAGVNKKTLNLLIRM